MPLTLVIEDDYIEEVIEVISAGIKKYSPYPEVEEYLENWCESAQEYVDNL